MKRVLFAVPVLALFATVAFAQMPAGGKTTLQTSLQRGYTGLKANLTQEAEKMRRPITPSSRARHLKREPSRR